MRQNGNVYKELVSIVEPNLKYYRNDLLVHDRELIELNPNVSFLHSHNDSHTSMILLWPIGRFKDENGFFVSRDFNTYRNWSEAKLHCYAEDTWLFHDAKATRGRLIKKITIAQAKEICNNHIESIGRQRRLAGV
jgi:hypothetical protein